MLNIYEFYLKCPVDVISPIIKKALEMADFRIQMKLSAQTQHVTSYYGGCFR